MSLEQIEQLNHKTFFITEHKGFFYASESAEELTQQGLPEPIPFKIRRVLVNELSRVVYQTILGMDGMVQLAALNAGAAADKIAALDGIPQRPTYSPEEEELISKGQDAQMATRKQVLQRGLVDPPYRELEARTEFYDDVLCQLITHFSEPGVVFPKVVKLSNSTNFG